jgi:hypothetical protein
MAINTQWDDNNKTRILVEFETSWTWNELETSLEQADNMIRSVSHSVDIIIDVEGSNLPKDFLTAARNLLANPEQNDNEGHRVVVGASNFMRQAYQAVRKAFGNKLSGRDILFANDLAHARSMLYSMRLDG